MERRGSVRITGSVTSPEASHAIVCRRPTTRGLSYASPIPGARTARSRWRVAAREGPALTIGFHFGPGFSAARPAGPGHRAVAISRESATAAPRRVPSNTWPARDWRASMNSPRRCAPPALAARAVLEALDAGVDDRLDGGHASRPGNPSKVMRASGTRSVGAPTLVEHGGLERYPERLLRRLRGWRRARGSGQAPQVLPDVASFAVSPGLLRPFIRPIHRLAATGPGPRRSSRADARDR